MPMRLPLMLQECSCSRCSMVEEERPSHGPIALAGAASLSRSDEQRGGDGRWKLSAEPPLGSLLTVPAREGEEPSKAPLVWMLQLRHSAVKLLTCDEH